MPYTFAVLRDCDIHVLYIERSPHHPTGEPAYRESLGAFPTMDLELNCHLTIFHGDIVARPTHAPDRVTKSRASRRDVALGFVGCGDVLPELGHELGAFGQMVEGHPGVLDATVEPAIGLTVERAGPRRRPLP